MMNECVCVCVCVCVCTLMLHQVTPVIIFQGLDDKVVPVNQAELMTAALAAKGVPHVYLALYVRTRAHATQGLVRV